MNFILLQVLQVVFSALTLTLALPNELYNLGQPFLAFICLFPLYTALNSSSSYKRTAFLFSLHVLCVHLTSSFWLANFRGYGIFSLGASALGTAFIGFCSGLVFFGAKIIAKNAPQKESFFEPFLRVLIFCSWYVFWEYFKSVGSMGYPWGTLSMAVYRFKIFTQFADVTGVWGITFARFFRPFLVKHIFLMQKTEKLFSICR